MKRDVSVVRFESHCNILISGKIIKEMPGSVATGTHCTVYIKQCVSITQLSVKEGIVYPTSGSRILAFV